jgi:hypothetical protein
LDLNPLPAQDFDGKNRYIIALHNTFASDNHVRTGEKSLTWDEPKRSDDEIARSHFEKFCPCSTRLTSKSDLLEHYGLVQVDAVEPNINELSAPMDNYASYKGNERYIN